MHINTNKPTPEHWKYLDKIPASEFRAFMSGKEIISKNPYPRGTGGRREDLDNRYFRSMMEANMARYYNFMGIKWEYEPCEFEFPVKRGIRFYKPDFLLIDTDVYVECKGWMDAKSKTKLLRMKKYHPGVKLQLLLWDEYMAIVKSVAMLIPGWEWKERK